MSLGDFMMLVSPAVCSVYAGYIKFCTFKTDSESKREEKEAHSLFSETAFTVLHSLLQTVLSAAQTAEESSPLLVISF